MIAEYPGSDRMQLSGWLAEATPRPDPDGGQAFTQRSHTMQDLFRVADQFTGAHVDTTEAQPEATVGRVVHYVVAEHDVAMLRTLGGNVPAVGDILPAVIVRVWSPVGYVNLKVLTDGPKDYWATSRQHYPLYFDITDGEPGIPVRTPNTWHYPPRV